MDESIKKVSVSLTDHEIDIVQDLNKLFNLQSFSAAMRMIIREWAQKTQPTSRPCDETTSLPEN